MLSRSAHAAFAIALGALGMLDELEYHDSACYTKLLRTHHPLVIELWYHGPPSNKHHTYTNILTITLDNLDSHKTQS